MHKQTNFPSSPLSLNATSITAFITHSKRILPPPLDLPPLRLFLSKAHPGTRFATYTHLSLRTQHPDVVVAKLPVPLLIYTTKTFNRDKDALNQSTREQLPNQNTIAIGIDTVHRHLSIESGTYVRLSDSQASDALSAIQSNYHGGDYTGATIAAIDSLQNALSGGGSSGGGITPLGVAVAIFLGIVAVVLVVIAIIRRRTGGSNGPGGGRRKTGIWSTPYPYYGGTYTTSPPPTGNYGGGAGGGFGGGSSGGGAGGSF